MARDPDGTIRHWSKGCERLYGWVSDEAIGRISHELLRTVFPIALSEIEAALQSDGEWSGELRHTTKDGRDLIVAVRKVLRTDELGNPIAVMESIADVTAQRAAEEKLAEKSRQLEQAAKMEALGRLAGGIAHDFNNILQILQTSLGLAAAGDPPNNMQGLFDLAERTCQRGAEITSRLLAFARQSDLRATSIAPCTMLSKLATMLQPIIPPSIELRVDAPLELPLIFADSGQLETVLVNLANNACDAMPGGGTLILRARFVVISGGGDAPSSLSPGGYVCLSVVDNGTGMPPDVLAHATEPFFTTKPPEKGTGLGLAMAYGFSQQSKGALSIDSILGQGTTVSLWLPQLAAPSMNHEAKETTVLLVEDEVELRSLFALALTGEGYGVVEAGTVESALALLEKGARPAAVITDLVMPGSKNGLDLALAIRKRSPHLPIIIISGYVGDVEADLFDVLYQDKQVRCLQKPFPTAALMAMLADLLKV